MNGYYRATGTRSVSAFRVMAVTLGAAVICIALAMFIGITFGHIGP
jgi:hypothetical protein